MIDAADPPAVPAPTPGRTRPERPPWPLTVGVTGAVVVASAGLAWLTLGAGVTRPPLPAEVLGGEPIGPEAKWVPLAVVAAAGLVTFALTRPLTRWSLAASAWAAMFVVAFAAWWWVDPRVAQWFEWLRSDLAMAVFGAVVGLVLAATLRWLWSRADWLGLCVCGLVIGWPAAGARRAVFAECSLAFRFAEDNRRVHAALGDADRLVIRTRAGCASDWVSALWRPHALSGRSLVFVAPDAPEFEQLRSVGFRGVRLDDPLAEGDAKGLPPISPAAFDVAGERLTDAASEGPHDPRFDSLVLEQLEIEDRGKRGPWLRIVPSAGRYRVQFALPTGVVRWLAVNPEHGVFPVDAALSRWGELVAGLPPGTYRVWWRIVALDRGLHTRWRVHAFAAPPR